MTERIEIAGHLFTLDQFGHSWSADVPSAGWLADDEGRLISIMIGATDEDGEAIARPSAGQVAAVKFFVANQRSVVEASHRASLVFLRDWQSNNRVGLANEKEITTVDELRSAIGIPQVIVHHESVAGSAWIGVATSCDWDEEHGHGLAIWKNIVLDVGDADTASNPEPYFATTFVDSQQAKRQKVLAKLLATMHAEEDDVESGLTDSLPLGVRLVQAICAGDNIEAMRLREAGASVNELPEQYAPAIFYALSTQSPSVVRAMIAAGASCTALNSRRQSALEHAKQMLETHTLAAQVRSHDPGGKEDLKRNPSGPGPANPIAAILGMMHEIKGNKAYQEATAEMGRMLDELAGASSAMAADEQPESRANPRPIESQHNTLLANLIEIVRILESQ